MNDDFSQIMTPFDQLVSNHSLQLIKLLIPFLPPQSQRMIAVYVKFMEFQHTLSFFRVMKQGNLDELKAYLPRSTMESYDNILNMMNMVNMMNMYQDIQDTSETESQLDPMSMMKDMLTPQQQDMFQMYQGMFAQDIETQQQKEGDTHD